MSAGPTGHRTSAPGLRQCRVRSRRAPVSVRCRGTGPHRRRGTGSSGDRFVGSARTQPQRNSEEDDGTTRVDGPEHPVSLSCHQHDHPGGCSAISGILGSTGASRILPTSSAAACSPGVVPADSRCRNFGFRLGRRRLRDVPTCLTQSVADPAGRLLVIEHAEHSDVGLARQACWWWSTWW